ncbi:hypothetical protein AQUCO_00100817v1 [Aquilegia coerulea]|uniref:Knottins-like domain-containing protein n=1 Tax=Aquilegia coerulea TaxID=218851 RepID=A0A2G5FCE9_AQUCA|nr:hypothetical protein AQUCO_00100817v1 [Aquilegia coerulea]
MAKLLTLVFVFLLLVGSFEMETLVEAATCKVGSATWKGWCEYSDECQKQCREWERYDGGSCEYTFPSEKCICYYEC